MTDRSELLARIASLYYEDNLTQVDVAGVVGISRSTVSRLLREAKETGIVEITVHYPWKTIRDLEEALVNRFAVHCAKVLADRGRSADEMAGGLGVLAARFLEGILQDGAVLGVSWGRAVQSTIRALDSDKLRPVTVVQMVGAVGEGDPLTDGPDLTRLLAQICAGQSRCLHAPLIVESAHVREALLQEPRIRETLSLAQSADVALVGIGSVVPDTSGTMWSGYLAPGALALLRTQGAVGNICARHYDAQGRPLSLELDRRIIGIELEALHAIERVIGVAGGVVKAKAILGAVRGGHVNVLITDEAAAREMMRLDGDET
jgi:DNA-binding transcriptional regulator LsrR (DeoR family)